MYKAKCKKFLKKIKTLEQTNKELEFKVKFFEDKNRELMDEIKEQTKQPKVTDSEKLKADKRRLLK